MRRKIKFLAVALFVMLSFSAYPQSVGINSDGSSPNSKAMLDVSSTTKGFLPPRMTDEQKVAIASPPAGLIVWCSNCGTYGELQVYNGAAWTNLTGGFATAIVDVTNPTTGKTWMDRNLGASRVATSSTDAQAYGDLYQWGRATDGHEKRNSGTTSALSSSDTPGHGNFITINSGNYDWRSPQNNNLWQGVNGINNPCPSGYRLPTEAELNAERASWSSNHSAGAFASPLKLPVAGFRFNSDGSLGNVGSRGNYWSSTVDGTSSRLLYFSSSNAGMSSYYRASGFSVRCLKDVGASASLPVTTTTTATNITSTTATTGGNVTSDGGATVTARGVCYATTPTPTIANSVTSDGTGTGEFTSSLTGLSASTKYYVRAYSTNSLGTAYGNEVDFTTAAAFATAIVDVTNPNTNKTWMDRNLGASRAATSSDDAEAYGDLYQWGRGSDGHEKRNSGTTSTLSSSDTPEHGNFILAPNSPYDWRSPQNSNLWQGVSGTNNPCPSGYRLPTEAEWEAELTSWSTSNATGAFSSLLKLPVAGNRGHRDDSLFNVDSGGRYWSSTADGIDSWYLNFDNSNAFVLSIVRAAGLSVRCLKD